MQQYIVIATIGLLVNLVDTLTLKTEYSLLGSLYANITPLSIMYAYNVSYVEVIMTRVSGG